MGAKYGRQIKAPRWRAGKNWRIRSTSSLRPPEKLEHQLQPELHHAGASGTDEGIACRDVGCGASTTEPAWA